MAVTLTMLKRSKGGSGLRALVQVVFSGNYPANGEPVDFSAVVGFTNREPDDVDVMGKAGFVYQYDPVNDKILVYCNTAGGANAPLGEHTAAAYAAGVTGDSITAECEWRTVPSLPV